MYCNYGKKTTYVSNPSCAGRIAALCPISAYVRYAYGQHASIRGIRKYYTRERFVFLCPYGCDIIFYAAVCLKRLL